MIFIIKNNKKKMNNSRRDGLCNACGEWFCDCKSSDLQPICCFCETSRCPKLVDQINGKCPKDLDLNDEEMGKLVLDDGTYFAIHKVKVNGKLVNKWVPQKPIPISVLKLFKNIKE